MRALLAIVLLLPGCGALTRLSEIGALPHFAWSQPFRFKR